MTQHGIRSGVESSVLIREIQRLTKSAFSKMFEYDTADPSKDVSFEVILRPR
jgi:hypothetical protein